MKTVWEKIGITRNDAIQLYSEIQFAKDLTDGTWLKKYTPAVLGVMFIGSFPLWFVFWVILCGYMIMNFRFGMYGNANSLHEEMYSQWSGLVRECAWDEADGAVDIDKRMKKRDENNNQLTFIINSNLQNLEKYRLNQNIVMTGWFLVACGAIGFVLWITFGHF